LSVFRAWGVRAGLVLVLVAVGVFGSSASAFARGAHPFIQGGTVANEGQFPWMAWVDDGYEPVEPPAFACSGTVVSPTVILTAGHCVTESVAPNKVGPYTIVTGAVNRRSGTAVRTSVSKVIPYPGFKLGGSGCNPICGHDAGLLVLTKPISSPAITLATSPGDEKLLAPGSTAYEAGWGLTSPNGTEASEDLRWTSTTIQCVGLAGCDDSSAEFSIETANTSQKGTCEGDSGGPLWSETVDGPVEIGLTSHGPANACNQTDSTRVDEIMPWIEETIDANWPSSLAPEPELKAPAGGVVGVEPSFSGAAWPSGAIKLHIYHGSTPTGTEVASQEATASQGEWATKPLGAPLEPGEYTAQATETSTYATGPGTSNAVTFSVQAAPTITALSPKKGPTAGRTLVTVTGTGFKAATAVKFGTVEAKSFQVSASGTTLTAESPEAAAGTAAIYVTTPAGTNTAGKKDKFTFVAPKGPEVNYTLCLKYVGGSEECEAAAFEVNATPGEWRQASSPAGSQSGAFAVTGKDYTFYGWRYSAHDEGELVGVKGKKGVIAGEAKLPKATGVTFTLTPVKT
jgi:hypothetical protein